MQPSHASMHRESLGHACLRFRGTGGPERRASLPCRRRGCKGGASRRVGQRECRRETTLIAAQHRTGGGSARTVISVPGAAGSIMAELPAKRRLEDPAKKSVAQISKTRQLEKMKDLESRVASLSRARDVLLVKNRMTKQLLAVKARTLQQGNQVTAYLRLENAKLTTALEDLKKLEGPPDAAELYRATSLLGPSFAVHDHLADVNSLFADASDRFHGDRCEDI